MGKLNRLTSWILVAAMVLTLFSGVAPMAVHAEEAPAISAAYPEATELLTNMGIMNNSEKAWNEQITAEEANALIRATVYNSIHGWAWNFDTFGLAAFESDAAVTGANFLHAAIAGLGWGTDKDQMWSDYFQLTHDVANYDPTAQLTREQAAQLIVNILKANPGYNFENKEYLYFIRGNALGIDYVKVGTDEKGRPSYQWVRMADNSPLTAAYAATPVSVMPGGSAWNDIISSVGLTAQMELDLFNAGFWMLRMFNYTISDNGNKVDGYGSQWPGQATSTFYGPAWNIEIYSSYDIEAVFGAGDAYYESKVYDLCIVPAYSAKYPEATELLMSLGIMSNGDKGWTDIITAEEANKVIDALLYKSLRKYGWSEPLFADGETVTGTRLIELAHFYNSYGSFAMTAETATAYFQLLRGIENYDPNAALTREQAAQLFINILRSPAGYAWNPGVGDGGVTQANKLNDDELGLTYEMTRDEMGRPSYQWKLNGQPVTGVYAAKPIFVSNNAVTTYGTLMKAVGYTPELEASIGWNDGLRMNKFGLRLINENIHGMSALYFINGDNTNALGGVGMSVAVYDSYLTQSVAADGINFCARVYDVVMYYDLLGDVQTIEGEKLVNMYGQLGGYGYWGGQVQFQNAEDGRYIVRWNQGQIQNVQKAESVLATLTAFNDATITIGDKVYIRSSRMYEGLGFLTAENLGKYFVFYFDTLGNVIGIDPAPSYTVNWVGADGTVLQSESVYHGVVPTYTGETPVKAEDADYTYTFSGWAPEISAVTGDITYTAQFTAEAKQVVPFELYGANMDLGNKLDMNFYILKSDITDEGSYVVITKYNADGSTTTKTIEKKDWISQSDDLWKVTFEGIAAKEMADKIEVVVYDSAKNAISTVREDGVRAYCERMLDKETNDVKKALYVDMLNYGAASQLKFNYNTGDLANANIDAYQEYATDLDGLNNNSNFDQVRAYYYGANMDLESSIKFNMYFLRSNVTADMKVTISFTDHTGAAQTMEGVLVEQSKDLWKVTLDKLVVADAEQMITCVIEDAEGNEVVTIVESMESYLARMSGSNELYEAIMKFGISANAYLHQNQE